MTLRSDDIEPGITPAERTELARVAAQIERERPVPAAVFRGHLGRRLDRLAPGMPARRRRQVAIGSILTGVGLLGLGAVGLTGAGPLAPTP